MEERKLIGAMLREVNYLWGLRNQVTRDLQGLFDDPFSEAQCEFREDFERNVVARVEGDRDRTHPARPVPFSERLGELRDIRSNLDCDVCLGVGVLTDGGLCSPCEGTGIDLSKRASSPFSNWAKTRAADAK